MVAIIDTFVEYLTIPACPTHRMEFSSSDGASDVAGISLDESDSSIDGDIEDHPGGIELSDADGDDDDLHAAAGSSIMYAIPQPMGGTERRFCTRSENQKLPPFGSVSWREL